MLAGPADPPRDSIPNAVHVLDEHLQDLLGFGIFQIPRTQAKPLLVDHLAELHRHVQPNLVTHPSRNLRT